MMAVVKLVGALVLGAAGSILGNALGSELPTIGRRLVLAAARWYGEHERQDFIDEMTDHVDCWAADGRAHRALWVGISEWSSALRHRGAPAWMLSEKSDRLGVGLVGGLVGGLGGGLVGGLGGGLVDGLGGGLVGGLVGGLGVAAVDAVVDAEADGLGPGPFGGLGIGLVGGLVGGLVVGMGVGMGVGLGLGLANFNLGLAYWYAPLVGRALMSRLRQRLVESGDL